MSNQNNNDNLFTQMFGLESEQPVTTPVTEAITEPSTIPVTEAPAIKEEKPTSSIPQNELIAALNFNDTPQPQQSVIQPTKQQNEVMMLAPTSREELEERTTPPTEPIIEEERFNPNAISSTPTEYVPSNFNSYDSLDLYAENTTGGKFFLKLLLIIIGVVVAIGGWFIFYTNVLKEENGENTQQVEENQQEETQDEEKTETPEEPVIYPIEFDEELSFIHSLTTNENELYQTEPFTPENSTGVIVCTNINPYSIGVGLIQYEYYLYYEDYKLKKTITNEISVYQTEDDYNTMLTGLNQLQQMWAGKEGIRVKVNPYPDILGIHSIAYFNLAYGNYFVTDHDSNIYYRLKYNYNDNIKTTIGTLLGIEIDNLVCSSVITTADAANNNAI